jgi:hypothetical protein
MSFPEQLVQHLHLSTHFNDVVTKFWSVFCLDTME